MRIGTTVVVLAILTAACSGGDAGTAPTPGSTSTMPSQQVPSVAGSYSGTTTLNVPDLQESGSCPTSTSVTQNGSTVDIAPIVLGGDCGGISIPVGQATIDAAGTLVQESGSIDHDCGVYDFVISGRFSGRELRITAVLTSSTCYDMNLTMSLMR
jgi:hypothetical protein